MNDEVIKGLAYAAGGGGLVKIVDLWLRHSRSGSANLREDVQTSRAQLMAALSEAKEDKDEIIEKLEKKIEIREHELTALRLANENLRMDYNEISIKYQALYSDHFKEELKGERYVAPSSEALEDTAIRRKKNKDKKGDTP